MKQLILTALRRFGYDLVKIPAGDSPAQEGPERAFPEMEKSFHEIWELAAPYTMAGPVRSYGLYKAVDYISRHVPKGAIIECGVWRGGSAMIAALTLQRLGDFRDIFLFDTYEGMPQPTVEDVRPGSGRPAFDKWQELQRETHNEWCYASFEEVRSNMLRTGYPAEKIHFIKGKVEDTLPHPFVSDIALLRLDTDFYVSTLHELRALFPALMPGGVLIIDDYGHWAGSKQAVDEYFDAHQVPMLLNRLDYTCRLGIKR